MAADETETVRVYVVAPVGTKEQDLTFLMRTTDAAAEMDTATVRFSAPGSAQ